MVGTMTDSVDIENVEISSKPDDTHTSLSMHDGVIVVINKAYGPTGEQLVGISDVSFDGFPALTLLIKADGREGLVHLSPLHGDRRKAGMTDIPDGTICELCCPVSKQSLDRVGPVIEGDDADYYAIYLTPKLSQGSAIYVSNRWGHYHSRVVDQGELISVWAAKEAEKG